VSPCCDPKLLDNKCKLHSLVLSLHAFRLNCHRLPTTTTTTTTPPCSTTFTPLQSPQTLPMLSPGTWTLSWFEHIWLARFFLCNNFNTQTWPTTHLTIKILPTQVWNYVIGPSLSSDDSIMHVIHLLLMFWTVQALAYMRHAKRPCTAMFSRWRPDLRWFMSSSVY